MSQRHSIRWIIFGAALAVPVLVAAAVAADPSDGSGCTEPSPPQHLDPARLPVPAELQGSGGGTAETPAAYGSQEAVASGACCGNDVYAAQCFYLTPTECDSIAGAYRGDGVPCPADCPLCHNDPRPCQWCWEGTLFECNCPLDWEGDFSCDCGCQFNDSGDCGGPGGGACCSPSVTNPECHDGLTQCQCDDVGGAYRGNGSVCPADCPLCDNDPRPCTWCWVGTVTENNCPLEWEGDTECDCGCQYDDAADCVAGEVGACCSPNLNSPECAELTAAECGNDGGAYRGAGSSCPADCPLCDGDPRPCDWCWEGTVVQDNCPPEWRGTDDGCDCACQWEDPDCQSDVEPPYVVHGYAEPGTASPCTGLIDPRIESDDGVSLNVGIRQAIIVFGEPVRAVGGGPVAAGAFTVRQTGLQPPPVATTVQQLSETTYRVELNRPISPHEWTTIQALVEDVAGNPILNSGDLGPGEPEPDRLDVGFLPCDINQDGIATPQDLIRLRQFLAAGSYHNDCQDLLYFDIDRDEIMSGPQDLLRFRQMLEGTAPATQSWALQEMNAGQP